MSARILLGNWRPDAPCKLSEKVEDHVWVDDTIKDERFCPQEGDQYCVHCLALKMVSPERSRSDPARTIA